jgi:hypothetical protein
LWQKFSFSYPNLSFPRRVNYATARLNLGKKLSGEALSPGFRLEFVEICKKCHQLGKNKITYASCARSPDIRDTMGLLVAAIHFNCLGGSVNRHLTVVEPDLRSRFRLVS